MLLKHGIIYRQSKVTLGYSMDPEYHLKKSELKNYDTSYLLTQFCSTKMRRGL
jgi:hypothetical protein